MLSNPYLTGMLNSHSLDPLNHSLNPLTKCIRMEQLVNLIWNPCLFSHSCCLSIKLEAKLFKYSPVNLEHDEKKRAPVLLHHVMLEFVKKNVLCGHKL